MQKTHAFCSMSSINGRCCLNRRCTGICNAWDACPVEHWHFWHYCLWVSNFFSFSRLMQSCWGARISWALEHKCFFSSSVLLGECAFACQECFQAQLLFLVLSSVLPYRQRSCPLQSATSSGFRWCRQMCFQSLLLCFAYVHFLRPYPSQPAIHRGSGCSRCMCCKVLSHG